jgi:sugar transferase (PEP-CTERM system associated)
MLKVMAQVLPREVLFVAASELLLGAVGMYFALWISGDTAALHMYVTPAQLNLVLCLTVSFGIAAGLLGLYRAEAVGEFHNLLVKSLLAIFLALLITTVLPAGSHREFGNLSDGGIAMVALPLAWLGCLVATRVAFTFVIQRRLLVRRIVVIASQDCAERFERFISAGRCRRLEDIRIIRADRPEGGAAVLAQLKPAMARRGRVWGVVVSRDCERLLPASSLLELRLRGVKVLSEAAFWEHEGCWIDVDGVDLSWVFDPDGFSQGRVAQAVKRAVDVVVALGLILLTLPLMILVAILIKIESPGSIFYRQERVGLNGLSFVLYKFRSMRQDAEAPGVPQWAAVADPRVTTIGRLMRCTRIDELPQLFNVLLGEMSVVGPRPERPFFVDQLAARIPFYAQRHCVKPGITGWAQVNAPYGASLEHARDKLRYDLYYVKNRSVFLDFWILACTVRTVLFQEGAR